MASDPLIWTPSAVHAELMRILGVLDTVNVEVSAASGAGKITGAEWNQWRQAYLAGHTFVTNASKWWGSNVITARQHEQEAGKWRTLVISRGGQTQGPSNLVRVPTSTSLFSVNLSTIALVVGGGALTLYLMSAMRKVAPLGMYRVARMQRRWQIRGIRPDGGRLAFPVSAFDYLEAKKIAEKKARGGEITDIVLLDEIVKQRHKRKAGTR